MSNFTESDEEFARRLQAQEMGISMVGIRDPQRAPLMVSIFSSAKRFILNSKLNFHSENNTP
jgi:hypothetical protein